MAVVTVGAPSITLTTSGATSTANAVDIGNDVYALSLIAPATLTGTVSVQVAQTSSATSYVTLQSASTDVNITAGRAIVISPFPFKQITLVSGAQEASQRVFTLAKIFVT